MSIQHIGNVSVFRCAENIGDHDEEQLRSAISSHSRAGALVLDLAQVTVIDSAWLGALVSAAGHAVANGVRLKLMNLRPSVEALIGQNNLLATFDICSPAEVIRLWCRAVCCEKRAA